VTTDASLFLYEPDHSTTCGGSRGKGSGVGGRWRTRSAYERSRPNHRYPPFVEALHTGRTTIVVSEYVLPIFAPVVAGTG
jgi:hypothetical protein